MECFGMDLTIASNVKLNLNMAAQQLSIADKIEIIRIVGDSVHSYRDAASIFNLRHPERPQIHYTTVGSINRTFNRTGDVSKLRAKKYNVADRPLDQVILDAVNAEPRVSVRDLSLNLNVDRNKIWRCLKRHNLKPYKPKFLHTMEEGDAERRLEYCFWAQGMFLNDTNFLKKIIFSDEATFTTNGVVSSQNSRYWSTVNPHWVINCKRQYSEKVNVWCGILNETLIGPFFFDYTLNSVRFHNFLTHEFRDAVQNLPLAVQQNLYFQLDGASIHNAVIVKNWLNNNFPMRWIGRNSPLIAWPPRSPDVTPMDFYFWGTIKNKVYKNRPRNRAELCDRIREACNEVTVEELRKVVKNNKKRIEKCIRIDGGLVEKDYI